MKQLITTHLFFYIYIIMYFTGAFIHIEADDSYKRIEQLQDQRLYDIYTTLRVIKKIHNDIESEQDHFITSLENEQVRQDFLVDIMIVLMGTYEKIVEATVTYYLMLNTPFQQNLHDTVARIIAEDVIKIIRILGKQSIDFIVSHQLTLQEKIWHCVWIISVITLMKIGINHIPQSTKPQDSVYILPLSAMDIIKINEVESGYLSDKFNSYK